MGRVKGLIKCSGRPIFYFIRENWGERRGGLFEGERPRSRAWTNVGRRWTRRVGEGLKNWTIFMNVICV